MVSFEVDIRVRKKKTLKKKQWQKLNSVCVGARARVRVHAQRLCVVSCKKEEVVFKELQVYKMLPGWRNSSE